MLIAISTDVWDVTLAFPNYVPGFMGRNEALAYLESLDKNFPKETV